MYIPAQFQASEPSQLLQVIRRYPLGLVIINVGEESVELAHAPCILNNDGTAVQFHLARANRVAQLLLERPRPIQIIFTGPDAYVSPTWYENAGSSVPTWNYISVLVRSPSADLINDSDLLELLRRLSAEFESGVPSWTVGRIDANALTDMLGEITGFTVGLGNMEGKFKLSQNRPWSDRERVREHLAKSSGARDKELAEWMTPKPNQIGTQDPMLVAWPRVPARRE